MSHDDPQFDFVRRHLSSALPPVDDAELKADLWPRMLRRRGESVVTFGWFESLLVGVVVITFAVFPDLLPVLLYHL